MVGINRTKHEEIIRRLEELKAFDSDPDSIGRIEKEIDTLTRVYEQYLSCMQGLRSQSEIYDSLYIDIRRTTYKELRKARYGAKRNNG